MIATTPGPSSPSKPPAVTASAPPPAQQQAALLARADSFRLNEQQNLLMTSEIAGMIGSGSGGSGNNSHHKVNGRSIVNGTNGSKKKSREASPVVVTSHQTAKVKNGGSVSQSESVVCTLTKDELRSVNLRNQNMRQMIYKEVKRPGRNYDKLFKMLKDLHGPKHVRMLYIGEVILEAKRFKRKVLAEILEQKMDELIVLGMGEASGLVAAR